MRRRIPLLGLALVIIALLLPIPTGVAASAITWLPCQDNPGFDCGTVSVPIDWNRRNGPRIALALARHKATDPAARVGSLLINPGGPGGSGVDFVMARPNWLSDELHRRFDIVGFDPRGVARSHPIVCSGEALNRTPYLVPANAAQFEALRVGITDLRADCRARTGPLYDQVNTLNVVRDLDAIRAALGEEKLTFYGVSYGTLLGQQYAEMYPRRVRALALDSNVDHSLDMKEFFDTGAVAAQDSFNEFANWCARSQGCALHEQGVRAVWTRLLAKADRGELRNPAFPDIPVTALSLISEAHLRFYGPQWEFLAQLLVDLDNGAALPPGVLAPYQNGEVATFPFPILCQDFDLRARGYSEYAGHLRRSARLAPDMRYGPLAATLAPICLAQPTPIPNPQRPTRVRDSFPLLLGTALHEPAAPYEWTVGLARQLGPYARVLTYEGWGHGVYGRSDCITGTFDAYLISRTLPPRGKRCEAVSPASGLTTRLPQPPPAHIPTPILPGWPSAQQL
ncbi:alpha/beta fold hydrolase [Streptosporangium carneum]|uniref:Peptidase n=1 Tax=Streptosporangium carneum TaxID=47481 RepID=A0A9W6I1P9_9ACTN|nr:alpha/beta fold hydrolase [Streptosporangium carneum]GLK09335.1 peptidase [Streptosporangium carneum]